MKASDKITSDFAKCLRWTEPDWEVGEVLEFPLYSSSIAALAAGGLENVQADGSRYLSLAGNRIVMGSGPSDRMALELGPAAQAFASLYRKLQVPYENFQIRILIVPALPLEALWIHTPAPESPDLIQPYLSLSPHFDVAKVYSDTTFQQAAKRAHADKQKIGFVATGPD